MFVGLPATKSSLNFAARQVKSPTNQVHDIAIAFRVDAAYVIYLNIFPRRIQIHRNNDIPYHMPRFGHENDMTVPFLRFEYSNRCMHV